jgi:hypothetical protein
MTKTAPALTKIMSIRPHLENIFGNILPPWNRLSHWVRRRRHACVAFSLSSSEVSLRTSITSPVTTAQNLSSNAYKSNASKGLMKDRQRDAQTN